MKQPSTKAEFDAVLAEAAAAGKAVVVDFTATWCGPCQRIAPLFAQLASEFPQADFIKVDVDENQETAAACQVSAMPTFKVFRDKKEVGMIRGADPNGLRALIQQHAGDKWSVAGEGQSLGSAQDTGGMSEREKRLAALERAKARQAAHGADAAFAAKRDREIADVRNRIGALTARHAHLRNACATRRDRDRKEKHVF